jgi:hypothetical protein
MTSTLSVYLSNHHDWASTWDYIAKLQPAWIRIHQPTARTIHMAQQASPDSKIMLRSWDIDDHNGDRKKEVYADAIDAANQHYDMWDTKLAQLRNELEDNGWAYDVDKWYLGLINEPDPSYLQQMVYYTAEFMAICEGWKLGVMVPSVGNYGIPGQDPNDWSIVKPLEKAIIDGGHVLMVHEYWQPEGPDCIWTDKDGRERNDAGNLAWRHQHIPLDVPILVGESGANGYIYNRHSSQDDAGWQKFMSAENYAAQVSQYIHGCDTRVEGVCLFLTDYHSDQWQTFDTTPAHDALLDIRASQPSAPNPVHGAETEMPVQVHVPIVVMDGPQVVDGDPHYGEDEPEQPMTYQAIDPYMLQAIIDVESNGFPFTDDDKPTIRFEAHIFRQQLANEASFREHFQVADERPWVSQQWYKDEGGDWAPIHTGQQRTEYRALQIAERLNREAAYRSISMGMGQTMGFNHARLGYPSAYAMWQAYHDETQQVLGAINYLLSDAALMQAIQRKDWRTIARLYNGAGNVDVYAPQLESAYERLRNAVG